MEHQILMPISHKKCMVSVKQSFLQEHSPYDYKLYEENLIGLNLLQETLLGNLNF